MCARLQKRLQMRQRLTEANVLHKNNATPQKIRCCIAAILVAFTDFLTNNNYTSRKLLCTPAKRLLELSYD